MKNLLSFMRAGVPNPARPMGVESAAGGIEVPLGLLTSLLIGVGSTVGGSAAAEEIVLYAETFAGGSSSGNRLPEAIGWKSYAGPTARQSQTPNGTPGWTIASAYGPDQTPGFLYARYDAVNTFGVAYEDRTISVLPSEISSIRLIAGNLTKATKTRIIIQQGSTWYVSTTEFSTEISSGTFNHVDPSQRVAEPKELTFSRSGQHWLKLNLVPGTQLAIDPTPIEGLSDQPIVRVGVYTSGVDTISRIDNLVITGIDTEEDAPVDKSPAVFRTNELRKLDSLIESAIAESKFIGGNVWVERMGASFHRAYGRRTLSTQETMTEDTIFDVASVTKVVATATAAMVAIEKGLMNLDDPVSKFLPSFTGQQREKITIKHLLLHTSGFAVNLDPINYSNPEQAMALASQQQPMFEPGTMYSYSSTGSMVLAEAIVKATGRQFDEFCTNEIFVPLGMSDTLFKPSGQYLSRVAPSSAPSRGLVDDAAARAVGGVAGHASLFTTTADLARFARMILKVPGAPTVLKPETIDQMVSAQSPSGLTAHGTGGLPAIRGLGFDIHSPGRSSPYPYTRSRGTVFPIGGVGHAGWTGQYMWMDLHSKTFVIFLCNRYNGGASGSPDSVYNVHREISTVAAKSLIGVDFDTLK
jgi:CubicO group peptidase (beta-lactamase class C family)